ncbi:MAG: GNAT family N-acetyltransferase [Tannerella sp.]|jgi:GNAT superfamily N-acetyltransferase|nr:GNAT family N-acetyltransferase [Tannerella sp.]
MEITAVKRDDVPVLSPLQPNGWVDIRPVFDFYIDSSFCFPIKVVTDHSIVGLGVVIIHNDVAWLAHVIVHPDYRCRGIGLQIVRTLIGIIKDNGCSTTYLIATDLGEPVYKKVGFITETTYLVHKDIVALKDRAISDQIHRYKDKYREQLLGLDRKTSGEDRMMHLEEHLISGRVYLCNDRVEGYYLPTLGEGLIIAETEKAGIELLKLHLQYNNRVVIPQENLVARKFLEETGVGEVKAIKRMRLGEERKVLFANIYNRIGGNVG